MSESFSVVTFGSIDRNSLLKVDELNFKGTQFFDAILNAFNFCSVITVSYSYSM